MIHPIAANILDIQPDDNDAQFSRIETTEGDYRGYSFLLPNNKKFLLSKRVKILADTNNNIIEMFSLDAEDPVKRIYTSSHELVASIQDQMLQYLTYATEENTGKQYREERNWRHEEYGDAAAFADMVCNIPKAYRIAFGIKEKVHNANLAIYPDYSFDEMETINRVHCAWEAAEAFPGTLDELYDSKMIRQFYESYAQMGKSLGPHDHRRPERTYDKFIVLVQDMMG